MDPGTCIITNSIINILIDLVYKFHVNSLSVFFRNSGYILDRQDCVKEIVRTV